MRHLFFALIAFILIGCAGPKTEEKQPLVLKPVSFSQLPGWGQSDDFNGFWEAFEKSCAKIKTLPSDRALGPLEESGTAGQYQQICAARTNFQSPLQFIEAAFQPYQVLAGNDPEGLFTGYYEASLRGSRQKYGPYRYPLHARPDDLVMVQLGDFREGLKGERIAGRVVDGNLKPYETRSEIVEGRWPHNDKVLFWVDDPVDAFFVQIQGSGVVELDDGTQTRIGYAGQNGHIYYAIGRELVKRGQLKKEEVSLQSIRSWLATHPHMADEIMNTNDSYVFFRELGQDGPIGGQGVALTPGRSLAIDRSLISYGLPIWVDIEHPLEGQPKLRRLMMTQDTGGAIRGPVRGDFFWGHGPEAEHMAGQMKSKGRYWILLPKI